MKNYLSPCITLMSLVYTCHAYPSGLVSDSVVMEMFSQIFAATGVFPDDENPDSYLLLVNEETDHCMNVKGGVEGNGQHVITYPCNFDNDVKAQSFYIHFVEGGYVGLSTDLDKCIGVGYDYGSLVYTGNWCESRSHQFEMLNNYGTDYVYFTQKETESCLTASNNTDVDNAFLTGDDCSVQYNSAQRWRFCGHNGTLCWPSQRPARG